MTQRFTRKHFSTLSYIFPPKLEYLFYLISKLNREWSVAVIFLVFMLILHCQVFTDLNKRFPYPFDGELFSILQFLSLYSIFIIMDIVQMGKFFSGTNLELHS